uniref:CBM20 domain-containing protein n=1 Tax=Chromera velia CCMP2878 TaxID=1169474 RepID=A0A0G4HQU3_9ALVE|eukprot:Cvel_7984.t1-p1 / transcript=Cvel_7984.t1 / gene=Cvel_7984 / organism=Chromera_velia_CCMP2878 / gene_product=Zinc finger protein 283, putative / transcript_product=Zinc finger protein 283, putative / location=Cvel_scaffold430:30594-33009(-) / protein_length=756 / sequence_SO=supercontig / SO=protein_coding / is_pseudo=false
MKGFIAFIAHCPEVRENQRVVVVGECAELGGWELAGALSLAPVPCGRPWWVSSEVEVNLPESTMGVSGDAVNGVGTGGECGGMGVSELKFRLFAIPNDDEETEVSHPGNLMCLEPLRGGDFRIVHLVSAPPLSDCTSVGERGVNTIHVGAEGGEGQEREVVGISVEWGVPESVQLVFLPLPTNRQTENPQHDDLSARPSEIACPDSSQGRKQTNSRIVKPANDSDSHDTSSIQSAVSRATSSEQKVLQRPPFLSTKVEKEERRHADTFAVKRLRSESDLGQIQADECDEVSGCPGERRGVASRESGGGSTFLREEKQRRLTVSLSDSAPLSSELCRGRGDLIAGGKVVAVRSVEGRVFVSMAEFALTTRIVVGRAFLSTAETALSARNVVGRVFVSMVGSAADARSAEGRAFVSTVGSDKGARSAGGRASVSTVDSTLDARNVAGRVFVSTAGSAFSAGNVAGRASVSTAAFALSARSAEEGPSVCTDGFAADARSAGGRASVSTVGSAFTARNVAGRVFVSMVAGALNAKSAEGRAYASTVAGALNGKSAEGRAYVSTVGSALSAKSAEGRVYVSTVDGATGARIVVGRVFVSTVGSALGARNVAGRVFVSTTAFALVARIVAGGVFVSTVAFARSARNVAGRAYVSTESIATSARTAEGGPSVFTERTVDTAMSASRSPLFLLDAFVFMLCFLHYLMSVKIRCPPFSLPFLLGVPTKSVHRSVFSERSVHSARSASMWPLLFLLLCLQIDVLFP